MKSLKAHLASRLRELRNDAGLTQDSVARSAQRLGLDWDRSTVAAIEAGNRRLSIEELLLIPRLYPRKGRGEVSSNPLRVSELFDCEEEIVLAPGLAVTGRSLRTLLGGPVTYEIEPGFRVLAVHEGGDDGQGVYRLRPERSASVAFHPETREIVDDVVSGAAQKLRVDVGELLRISRSRWGRGLTEERERRLAERLAKGSGSPPTARSMQALRGHVTRELLAELAAQGEVG